MATKPKAAKPKAPRPSQTDAIFAMATFIAALPPQPADAELARAAALDAARAVGWKG